MVARRSRRQWIACALGLACGLVTRQALAGKADAPGAAFRDGVVLVGYQDGVSAVEHGRTAAAVGAIDVGTIGAGTHVLRVPRGAVPAIMHALGRRPEVRYVEPDWIGYADGVPNDTSFASQWAFQNTGRTFGGTRGVSGADEKAVPAWNVATGSKSVVVGVTDTGIEYTHPDLAANVWSNPGGVNGCATGTHGYNVLVGTCDPMDDDTNYNGHGTHVAGIIGAVTNNSRGVAGVNWVTNLLAVKWLNSHASGSTSSLIMALDWLLGAKQAGVNIRVVNDSATFSGTAYSQALSDEIDRLGANDILFVTAAGNTAQSNDDLSTRRYPCGYMRPNELCVGATDNTDHLWTSSNYGVQTVNLAAPGYYIFSTLRGSSYGFISGCSMSAAEVSGAAALILSTGYQSATTLRTTILNSVDVLASLSGLVQTSGRLNICNALPGCTPNSTTTSTSTTSTPTTTTTPPAPTTTTTTTTTTAAPTTSTSTTTTNADPTTSTSTTTTTAAPTTSTSTTTTIVDTTTSTSTTTTTAAPTTSTSTTTTQPPATTTTTIPPSAIGLVQSSATEGSGLASVSSTFPSNNTAGNLLVVVVRMSTTTQTVTVTDSLGNVYAEAVAQAQAADGHQVHVFYAANAAGGPNTVTATFSATNNHPWLAVFEYRGLVTVNPLDQTAHAQGNGTMATSGATGPTATASELVVAVMGLPASYKGTAVAGTGFTLQQQDTGTSRAAVEALVGTTTASYVGTFGLSPGTNWTAVVATFAAP